MDSADQRQALADAAQARGESLAALSRVIGRNAAYLQQFVTRGTPRQLAEGDRRRLARYLGVSDAALGGPEVAGLVAVARVDVGASAGRGRLVDQERVSALLLDPALLRRLAVRADMASVIRVEGDSMAPTLHDGDEILVDRARRTPAFQVAQERAAMFVFRRDGLVSVKRLRRIGDSIEVLSDNPDYPRAVVGLGVVEVIGRVVWMHRTLI